LDVAIRDFSTAIEINPKIAITYKYREEAIKKKEQLENKRNRIEAKLQ
jgi:hypothetical protein